MPGKFVTNSILNVIVIALLIAFACRMFLGLEAIPSALIALNVVVFQLVFVDKQAAQRGTLRVPEYAMLGLALLGGSPGLLLAMIVFRHKTKKTAFILPLCIIIVLQLALLRLFA